MKYPSLIDRWEDWPSDVVQVLRAWNHTSVQRLRFPYTKGFTCSDCGAECVAHRYGDAALDGNFYCDDCLIGYTREYLVSA